MAETLPPRDRLRLVRLIRLAPLAAVASLLCEVVVQATSLLIPVVLAGVVDTVVRGSTPGRALALLAALLTVRVLCEAAGGLADASASTGVTARLRERLVRHVLASGIPGIRRHHTGDLVARLTANTAAAGHAVPALAYMVLTSLTTLGGLVALWLLDWRLGVVFLAGAVPSVYLLRRLTRDVTDRYAGYLEKLGDIAGRLTDALTGARTIRATGTAGREIERVLAPLPGLRAAGASTWDAQRAIAWKIDTVITVFRLGVLAVAGAGLAAGRLTPGDFLAAAMYLTIALGFLDQVDNLVTLAEADANAERVTGLLAEPVPAVPTADGPPPGPGALSFHGVHVSHDDRVVLDGLDLAVPAGAAVAVVGRSGAGKTTLALLAGGLVPPDDGEVRLDGVPLTRIPGARLRREFAYAFDRPVLLGSTVADAIAYGDGDPGPERIRAAARAARAEEFVDRLPGGFDTPLSTAPLSGGETQRLGLARALARDGTVLVLDDATSSLDTATEAQVADALTTAARGRTRLIVAHRAATAARADLVAWLENGRVRSLAPHRRLWTDEPEYREVFADEGTAR
ncbi:ATP-binding cassette domain-containing protein [Phytomonospora endophytica]|uniref:ATP-binding cassette subfamily B protein n=1 Tax=Phytomonospora endophytica TaxID=714109 RepID=A0A841FBE6_9ACTN|nr:ABC transporter ATP-binding protein [Phytomonospora endophytica]MBB6033576.1 ATP-binding cassette subfamily B protein [Phytomonospora endophytica]GIG64908.1 ABC transporter ATP-binding protein [Phytomonospora endophytica]